MADDRAAESELDESEPSLQRVPLFPLPNVVLLPRAILPLHVFEERYKQMTADALAGKKQIAMCLLRSGWEKGYGGDAAIEPAVCIGEIVAHKRLPNGTYNLLLQGVSRAEVVREITQLPYRLAELREISQPPVMELDLVNQRRQLISIFSNGRFNSISLCKKFLEMLSSPISTSDIIDLIGFNLIESLQTRQQLLAQPDPRRRAERVVMLLEQLQTFPSSHDAELN